MRTSEPASDKGKDKLGYPVISRIHSFCKVSSQCPPTVIRATSPCLHDEPNHVIRFGQWDVNRLDAVGMEHR